MTTAPDDATIAFREALRLAASDLVTEAIAAFEKMIETWPKHDLADDALYDLGACYLHINQHDRAAACFERLIAEYPDAEIASEELGGREVGRTAAKAQLGLVATHLGRGDMESAKAAADALADDEVSKVRPTPGVERSFHEVAQSLLLSATAGEDDDVDDVGPESCQEAAEDDGES
ncbi:MAG: tetratricopeptide repeat protein [Acidobacteriota bacterium]